MIFFSIFEFSISSRFMRSPMAAATPAMETASMRSTPKTRPPPRRKASDITAVIKAAERAGACSWLTVKRRVRVPVEGIPMVEIVVARVAVVEVVAGDVVAIDDRSAMGDVGVVVVDHAMAMPIASPVMPAPTISSEETDAEPDSKSDPRSSKEDSRNRVPAWICDDRLIVYEPRIIGRHIDHFRVGRFNDDGVPLSRYLFLFIAVEVAGLVSLLMHRLDGIGHILLLVAICVAEG